MDNRPTKQDFLLSILALDAYNRGGSSANNRELR